MREESRLKSRDVGRTNPLIRTGQTILDPITAGEAIKNTAISQTAASVVTVASLPTLDQFVAMLSKEDSQLAASASGYNVYNKYNKAS